MKHSNAAYLFLLIGLLAGATAWPARAQALEEGRWPGRMILPSGVVGEVSLHVDTGVDSSRIELELGDSTRHRFRDIRYEENSVYFSLDTDFQLNCVMHQQLNESYQGTCVDEFGGKGRLILIPPGAIDAINVDMVFEDWLYYWKGRL